MCRTATCINWSATSGRVWRAEEVTAATGADAAPLPLLAELDVVSCHCCAPRELEAEVQINPGVQVARDALTLQRLPACRQR